MITQLAYRQVLADLAQKGILSRPIETLIGQEKASGLFIKHDVEAKISLAVTMAENESDLGHRATYYFQGDFLDTDHGRQAIRKIAALGHEVAYHYDVLDAHNGDYEKARREFTDTLHRFAEIGCPIKTVCPHGNPTRVRVGWKSNKDFFRDQTVRDTYPEMLDIVIDFEAFFDTGLYISDAGYKLRIIGDISGNDKSNDAAMQDGQEIQWDELEALTTRHEAVVISAHPHRYMRNSFLSGLQKGFFRVAKSAYLILRRIPFVSAVVSKFYKLARRL